MDQPGATSSRCFAHLMLAQGLSAPEAAVMICGNSGESTSDFDLRHFFRVTVDDDLVESGMADALWQVKMN